MMVAVMMMETMMWGWPCDRVLYWEAGHYRKRKCFRLVSNTKKFYDDHLIVYFQTFIMDNPHPVLGSAALILTFVQPLIAMIRCRYEIEAISFYIFSCGQAPSRVKKQMDLQLDSLVHRQLCSCHRWEERLFLNTSHIFTFSNHGDVFRGWAWESQVGEGGDLDLRHLCGCSCCLPRCLKVGPLKR